MTVQLVWRSQYVIVDGYTYRNHPKWLVLAQHCEMLPMSRAAWVLEHIAREDREMLNRLCTAFDIEPRTLEITDALKQRLGPPAHSPLSPPGKFARMYVLERERLKPPKEVPLSVPKTEQRSLDEIRSSISLALVDEWGNSLADIPFELTTMDGANRSGTFSGTGEAIEGDVKEDRAELELNLVGIGDDDWMRRAAPPTGWLQKGVAITLRDATGEPLSGANAKIVFANGAALSLQLDPTGTCRADDTPSWPLRVEFPDLDPESYQ